MASFEGEAKDSEQVHIGAINCAPPFTHQLVDFITHVQMQSTDTWLEDSLQFHLEGDFHLESDIEAIKVYQCLLKLSRSSASYESSKPYESNLNNISDMKNSEATKQPMLPDTSTCVRTRSLIM